MALALSVIAGLLLLIIRIAMVFCYDSEFTGIDNNFIYPVIRQLQGGSIYPDPEQYPFPVNPYAPLLFYLSAFFCQLFGITGNDPIQVYFVTRGICLVADLTTLFVLFRMLKRFLGISNIGAMFSTVAFFFLISYWSFTVMRSDSLLLLFYSLILYSLLWCREKPGILQLMLIALLCNAAIFSKQNGIYLPFMVTGVFIIHGKFRAAWIFALFFAGIFASLLLLFTNIYENHFFSHLVTALNNRVDVRWFYQFIFKRLVESFLIIPFAVGCWYAFQYLFRSSNIAIKTVSIVALCSVAFSLIIAFKWGSSIGYLNESMLALTMILAFMLKNINGLPVIKKMTAAGLFCIAIIYTHIALQLYFYHLNNFPEDREVYRVQKTLSEELLAMIGNEDVYVFADDVNGTFFKNSLRDRLVAPNKDAIDCCTLPDGNFDYALFREGFSNGKIRYLVFQEQWVPERFHDISLRHYKKIKVRFGYAIYAFQQ